MLPVKRPNHPSFSFISPIANGFASTKFSLGLSGKLKTELDIAVEKGEVASGVATDSFGRAAAFRPVLVLNTLSSRTMTNGDRQFIGRAHGAINLRFSTVFF